MKKSPRQGYVPMMVGMGDESTMKRVEVPIKFLHHTCIVQLLDASVEEFGYSKGLIKIKYDPDSFDMKLPPGFSMQMKP
ncbi:hypothetical protein SAY87_018626 [Trapa incisa]|uniref:Auxin-responsive protein n=1 Tax=Trapa incisa TaxID=236973 RepID=A0AAN7Q5U5_9MYRT|nr:hypothetical protein SAY87_018626 [Trapa incisa]